jgi:hypothetical protein
MGCSLSQMQPHYKPHCAAISISSIHTYPLGLHALGYLSGVAVLAWRKFHFAGVWRSIVVMSIPIVLYLNVLALIVQIFKHIPSLMALAPTLSESPFLVTEFLVLMPFAMYGIVAARRFQHEPPR